MQKRRDQQKKKNSHFRWVILFSAFTSTLALGTSTGAENKTKFSDADYYQLERDYVNSAFGGDVIQLTKFPETTQLTRSFECDSNVGEKCLSTLSLFKYTISQSSLLSLRTVKGQSDLRIILADKDRLLTLKSDLEEKFSKSIVDNSSIDCQLYIAVAGAIVTSAVTVISVEADPLRAQTCMIVNLFRSVGLSLNEGASFSEVWGNADDERSKFTLEEYEELKYRINILLLIHACKDLRSGMTKQEVEIELNPKSQCFKNLEEISNG